MYIPKTGDPAAAVCLSVCLAGCLAGWLACWLADGRSSGPPTNAQIQRWCINNLNNVPVAAFEGRELR